MTKIISLIVSCYLISSCHQHSNNTKLNIDGIKASPNNFKLLLENEHVRMLEYSLKPGEKDMPHTHPAKSAYIVSGGKIKVYLENGGTEIFDEKAGTADWSDGVGNQGTTLQRSYDCPNS